MMPAYITGVILLSIYLSNKWLKIQLAISLAIHIVLAIEVIFYPLPIQSDDTWFGWSQLAGKMKAIKTQYPRAFVFAADDYKTSAILNFYSDTLVYSQNVIGERALQFDFIGTDLSKLRGRDGLFLNSEPRFTDTLKEGNIPAELSPYFVSVKELEPIVIANEGEPVRKFLVYYCKGYRGLHAKNTSAANSSESFNKLQNQARKEH